MSSSETLPVVDIDAEGVFKYYLIKAIEGNATKLIVRGYKRCVSQTDILGEVEAKESAGGRIKFECPGGGRIRHEPGKISFVQDFGGADDRTLVMKQLQGQYPDYEVELVGSEEDRETVVNLIVQAVGEAAENVQTGEEPERFDFVHCRVDSQPIMFNICSNNNNMFGGLARSSHAVFIFQNYDDAEQVRQTIIQMNAARAELEGGAQIPTNDFNLGGLQQDAVVESIRQTVSVIAQHQRAAAAAMMSQLFGGAFPNQNQQQMVAANVEGEQANSQLMAAATMQELDANLAAATETSTAVNLMPAGLLGNLQTVVQGEATGGETVLRNYGKNYTDGENGAEDGQQIEESPLSNSASPAVIPGEPTGGQHNALDQLIRNATHQKSHTPSVEQKSASSSAGNPSVPKTTKLHVTLQPAESNLSVQLANIVSKTHSQLLEREVAKAAEFEQQLKRMVNGYKAWMFDYDEEKKGNQ